MHYNGDDSNVGGMTDEPTMQQKVMRSGGIHGSKDTGDVSPEDMEAFRMKRHKAIDPMSATLLGSDAVLEYK